MPRADDLCPLGFAPHSVRPTRCKRCFRDFNEHKQADSGGKSKSNAADPPTTTFTLRRRSDSKAGLEESKDDPSTKKDSGKKDTAENGSVKVDTVKKKDSAKAEETSKKDSTKRVYGARRDSDKGITKHDTKVAEEESKEDSSPSKEEEEMEGDDDDEEEQVKDASSRVRRRRTQEKADDEKSEKEETSSTRRTRSRYGSSSTDQKSDESKSKGDKARSPSPGSRYSGRRRSGSLEGTSDGETKGKKQRLQILSAQEVNPSELPGLGSYDDEDASPDVAFIIQVKASTDRMRDFDDEDTMSTAPTDTTETTLTFGDTLEDLQSQLLTLKNQLEATEERCNKLEQDNKNLQDQRMKDIHQEAMKTAADVIKLRTKINELETTNEDLKDENNVMKLEVKELQEEMEKRPTQEDMQKTTEELRNKLIAAESLCEELMDENEDIKREIRDLEDEIEEMQDNFREDQADEYRDLKKELEQTAKNCRILQFKLRKAEKRCETLENDKNQYEERLKEVAKGGPALGDAEKLKQMEVELNTAREVSIRMHSEVETLQNKLRELQEEKETIAKQLESTEKETAPAIAQKPTSSPVARREAKLEFPVSGSKDSPLEMDPAQLLRDLYDTIERENDLKEQFKFTEEEAQNLRKKLQSLEQENETLVMQIKKMATTSKKTREGKKSLSREGSKEDDTPPTSPEDDLSQVEMKLQMELTEQEAVMLRKKVEELEQSNENLQKEVKELKTKADQTKTSKTPTVDLTAKVPKDPAKANIFYEQKVKLLESEAKELRLKLIDKERENERLTNELSVCQKKGSKGMMTRSRSLDSDAQLDLKRQLQLVEQEATILRQKTLELETENEKLGTENRRLQLRVGKKAPPSAQEEKAIDQQILKEKIADLEQKLSAAKERKNSLPLAEAALGDSAAASLREQMKQKTEELDSLQTKIIELNKENQNLNEQLKSLKEKTKPDEKEKTNGKTKPRKKIPDSASKTEFKKAVESLEKELDQLTSSMKAKEAENTSLSKELDEKKKSLAKLKDERETAEKKSKEQVEKLTKNNESLTKDLKEEKEKAKKTNEQLQKLEKERDKIQKEAEKGQQKEIKSLQEKVAELQKALDEEKDKATTSAVKFEDLRKVEQDKHKLQKELLDYQVRVSDAEKRVLELEQNARDTERVQRNLRHQIEDLNSELEREKSKLKKVDSRQTEVAMGWLKERDELKKQMNDLQKKNEDLKRDVDEREKKRIDQDSKIREINRNKETLQTNMKLKEEEMKSIKEHNNKLKAKLKELEEKFSKVDLNMEELTEKWRKLDQLYKKEKDEWNTKQSEMESSLKHEIKRRERQENEHQRDLIDKDEEMIRLREKARKSEMELNRIMEAKGNSTDIHLKDKLAVLEAELSRERQEYEDLTSKYEMLEEEHVMMKATLVREKEELEIRLQEYKRGKPEEELRALKDTFSMRQDTWIKEKVDLQEKLKDLENKVSRSDRHLWDADRRNLTMLIDERDQTIEQLKKQEKNLKDDLDKLRRQGDDLRQKLTDFERARGYGRSSESSSSQREMQDLKNNLLKTEIEELRNKLQQEEKVHRSEVTAQKMMNDVKIAQMQDEIQMLHIQIGKFRRERDTYKEMMEGAQRTIGDLKSDSLRRREGKAGTEIEELKEKLTEMRKTIEGLQDQLDDGERTNSRQKTEYLTEKASWEIRASEMQTKINELEESIILQGGKSRIFGVKTKLELAWQKEREEQQRLLNESHKMAKDLRQRVIDLENARDRERQEAKRQLDELRKTVESDQAETQTKINELQSDLVELRDAHSKMRGTNDRLKREKEKAERDREEMKMKLSESQHQVTEDVVNLEGLADEVEKIKMLIPSVLGEGTEKVDSGNEKPKLRGRTTPTTTTTTVKAPSAAEMTKIKEEFKASLVRITKATKELKRSHGAREEERVKKSISIRRALSAADSDLEAAKPPAPPSRGRKDDPLSRWQNPQRITNYPLSPPSMFITPPRGRHSMSQQGQQGLYRKSLSLDQSLTIEQLEQGIWKAEEEAGSTSSLGPSFYHERSQSSGGEYASTGGHLEVPGVPSPAPRRKKRLQSSTSSLESSPLSSRETSVEKETKPSPPPRPPSPNLTTNRPTTPSPSTSSRSGAASPAPKADDEGLKKTSAHSKTLRNIGKSRSIEETPTGESVAQAGLKTLKPGLGPAMSSELASASTGDLRRTGEAKPKGENIKSRISSIFKRTSSMDSADERDSTPPSSGRPPTGAAAAAKAKFTPKPPVQYRSTSALQGTKVDSCQDQDDSYSSLSRRILRRFHIKSKSIDDPSPASSSKEDSPRRIMYSETPV